MKKELILLRHAKSDWNSRYTIDRGRPLNKRGNRDAQMIGNWMTKEKIKPDMILCSPAKRATATLKKVLDAMSPEGIKLDYIEPLYLADLTTLLEIIASTPDSVQKLMLVGHNPGLEELVTYLSIQEIPPTNKGKKFTTANLAILETSESFEELQSKSCNLHRLIRPKELRKIKII